MYKMLWSLEKDGISVQNGEITDVNIAPLTTKEVKIPYTVPTDAKEGDEYFLHIQFVTKADTSWGKAGDVVAEAQFDLNFEKEAADRGLDTSAMKAFADSAVKETKKEVTVKQDDWSVTFNKEKEVFLLLK